MQPHPYCHRTVDIEIKCPSPWVGLSNDIIGWAEFVIFFILRPAEEIYRFFQGTACTGHRLRCSYSMIWGRTSIARLLANWNILLWACFLFYLFSVDGFGTESIWKVVSFFSGMDSVLMDFEPKSIRTESIWKVVSFFRPDGFPSKIDLKREVIWHETFVITYLVSKQSKG